MEHSPKGHTNRPQKGAEKAPQLSEKLKDYKEFFKLVEDSWKLAQSHESIDMKYNKNGDKYEVKYFFDTDPEPPYYTTFIDVKKTQKSGSKTEIRVTISHDKKDSYISIIDLSSGTLDTLASAKGASTNPKDGIAYKNKSQLLRITTELLNRLQTESKRLKAKEKKKAPKKSATKKPDVLKEF